MVCVASTVRFFGQDDGAFTFRLFDFSFPSHSKRPLRFATGPFLAAETCFVYSTTSCFARLGFTKGCLGQTIVTLLHSKLGFFASTSGTSVSAFLEASTAFFFSSTMAVANLVLGLIVVVLHLSNELFKRLFRVFCRVEHSIDVLI